MFFTIKKMSEKPQGNKSIKKQKKKKDIKSRWLKITLTSKPSEPFSGDEAEWKKIKNILETNLPSVNDIELQSIVTSLEKHPGDGRYHYHALSRYSVAFRTSNIISLRNVFERATKSCTNEVKLGVGNYVDWFSYVIKDGVYKMWALDPKTLDKYDLISKNITVKKSVEISHGNACEILNVPECASVINELYMLKTIKNYFVEKNIKINALTRKLFNIKENEFWENVSSSPEFSAWGKKYTNLIESLISSRNDYTLPRWNPSTDIAKFKDCFYNMSTGETLDLDKKITPVRTYDFEYKNIEGKTPEKFIGLLKYTGVDVEEFRKSYGRQYKKKKRRDKCLLLNGIPHSGKSALITPFKNTFKNIIMELVSENQYTFAAVANTEKLYCEEVSFFLNASKMGGVDNLKKLLEGAVFAAPVKFNEPVEIKSKTGIFASNYNVPCDDTATNHQKAIKDRLDIFDFKREVGKDDTIKDIEDYLDDLESAKVMVWATQF